MLAEFFVARCSPAGTAGITISGRVESGLVREGTMGRTFKGKRFTVVKIVKLGSRIIEAEGEEEVSLFLRDIAKEDIRPGEIVYFD